LQRHAILSQVDAAFTTELIGQPVDNALIEIVTTEVSVTTGTFDFKDTIA